MGILPFIIFLIIYAKGTKRDNRRSDSFKLGFSIFSIIALIAIFESPLGILAVLGLVGFGIKKLIDSAKAQQRASKYGWDPQRWDKEMGNARFTQQNNANAGSTVNGTPVDTLPKPIGSRKNIIDKFNKKYNLCLTPEQIQSIANSSYMSRTWNQEVQAMCKDYEVVYQWLNGPTKWLRVYMYVFHVQEITSDITQQENIAMYAFEEVFRFADELGNVPNAEKINKINSHFMTAFDDATFMSAYRFLESKGLKHKLYAEDLVENDSNVDELLKKYRVDETPMR